MKTFEDLEFKQHEHAGLLFDEQAVLKFDNGYGVSVITGRSAYSSDEAPYELAVLRVDEDGDWILDYDNPVADGDVVGYLDKEGVSSAMAKVQSFSKADA